MCSGGSQYGVGGVTSIPQIMVNPSDEQRADSWRCERVDAHCCHLDEARYPCAGLNDWRLMFCQKVGTCSVVEMITVLWMAVGSLASVVR